MKKLWCVLVAALLLLGIWGCSQGKYKEADFLGKTSLEIEEKFGKFEQIFSRADTDGLYRNCACGYITKDAVRGFLGTDPPEYFLVYFDSDGIAYECRKNIPGGWGG